MSSTPPEEEAEIEGLMPVRSSKQGRHWLISCIREGSLDTVLPLFLLIVLSIAVLVYNTFFRHNEPCDSGKAMAKHFYCFNASLAPGVHKDA